MGTSLADDPQTGALGILFGVGAIIILPIVYGLLGFVGGAIVAWIYNIAARLIGGIELEIKSPSVGTPMGS